MNVTIYTADRLGNFYFTPGCRCSLSHRKLVLTRAGEEVSLVIRGDDYILKKLCDNLSEGVCETVLRTLLSGLPDGTVFERMMEGNYIE